MLYHMYHCWVIAHKDLQQIEGGVQGASWVCVSERVKNVHLMLFPLTHSFALQRAATLTWSVLESQNHCLSFFCR